MEAKSKIRTSVSMVGSPIAEKQKAKAKSKEDVKPRVNIANRDDCSRFDALATGCEVASSTDSCEVFSHLDVLAEACEVASEEITKQKSTEKTESLLFSAKRIAKKKLDHGPGDVDKEKNLMREKSLTNPLESEPKSEQHKKWVVVASRRTSDHRNNLILRLKSVPSDDNGSALKSESKNKGDLRGVSQMPITKQIGIRITERQEASAPQKTEKKLDGNLMIMDVDKQEKLPREKSPKKPFEEYEEVEQARKRIGELNLRKTVFSPGSTSGSSRNKKPKGLKPRLPEPPPELPQEFKQRMKEMGMDEEKQPTLVIQKYLTATDVEDRGSRLSMPYSKLIGRFLSREEKIALDGEQNIEVDLIDPKLRVCSIKMRKWDMPKKEGRKSSIYVLKAPWNKVREENELEEYDVIQVWAFHTVEKELRLALVKLQSQVTDQQPNRSN